MNNLETLLKRVFLFLLFGFLCLLSNFSFAKNVSAAPFNVTVEDNIPETRRWSSDDSGSACDGPKGITLRCLNNCSNDSFQWDCSDGLGGHLNIWGANEGSSAEIQVQLVEPLPTAPSGAQFTGCTWTFFEFTGNPQQPTREHGSGSDCTAEFVIPEGSGDFQYGVMFVMHTPPTPTPTPGPTATSAPTATPTPSPAHEPPTGGCHIVGVTWLCQEGFDRCPAPFRYVCCVDLNDCPTRSAAGGGGSPQYFCNPNDPTSGIESAIGCIPYANMNSFSTFMLLWFIGLGGGIAFLLMLYGGFLLITSAGNPERVKMGRTILVSALSGLLFIIFSVFLLRTIGVEILNIPNF